MATLNLPGGDEEPARTRTFDEVILFDLYGRKLKTLKNVGSAQLVKVGMVRQLHYYLRPEGDPEGSAYKVMFFMLLGGWIVRSIQLFGQF